MQTTRRKSRGDKDDELSREDSFDRMQRKTRTHDIEIEPTESNVEIQERKPLKKSGIVKDGKTNFLTERGKLISSGRSTPVDERDNDMGHKEDEEDAQNKPKTSKNKSNPNDEEEIDESKPKPSIRNKFFNLINKKPAAADKKPNN